VFLFECVAMAPLGQGSIGYVRMVSAGLVVRLLRFGRLFRTSHRAQALVSSLQTMVPFLFRFLRMLFFVALLFSIVGVACFGGKVSGKSASVAGTPFDPANGAYSYMPMNFNDVPSGLVVLFALLVLNNWFVFCDQFVAASGTEWTRVFFVCWWIIGVCCLLNVLVAFVLEVFVSEFQHYHDKIRRDNSNMQHIITSTRLHAVDSITQDGGGIMESEHGRIVLKTTRQIDSHFAE